MTATQNDAPTIEDIQKSHPFVGTLTDSAYSRWMQNVRQVRIEALLAFYPNCRHRIIRRGGQIAVQFFDKTTEAVRGLHTLT